VINQADAIRLKWTTDAPTAGAWGEEADGGADDIVCVRVADFDRIRFRVSDDKLTTRRVEPNLRQKLRLSPGDLLVEKSGGGELQPVGAVVLFDLQTSALSSNFIARLRARPGYEPRFLTYVHAHLYSRGINRRSINQTTGIQNLDLARYLDERFIFACLDEQRAIADFLDRETAKIDDLIAKKRKLVSLSSELASTITEHLVLRGANSIGSRPTPVPTLPVVPIHWQLTRAGRLFRERDDRGQPDLPLLNVSLNTGVTVRTFSEDRVENVAEDYNTYKVARCGDLAFNKMRMWQGAVGVTPADGLVSPDYTVAQPLRGVSARYFSLVFRTSAYKTESDRHSHGIVPDRNRLYWDGFKQILCPHPPYDEQLAILQAVDGEIERLTRNSRLIQATVDRLTEYRSALISAAVTGQLDVRKHERALEALA
jgi:type I restriction enzyme S subunit